MALRDFVLNNFRLKLTALLLALLVWFVIRFGGYRWTAGAREQILRDQPVLVLKSPEDPRIFRLQPPRVDVLVQSTNEITPQDVEVFVNLTSMPDVDIAFKQVIVRAASTAKLLFVEAKPLGVTVERWPAPNLSLTNSSRKP